MNLFSYVHTDSKKTCKKHVKPFIREKVWSLYKKNQKALKSKGDNINLKHIHVCIDLAVNIKMANYQPVPFYFFYKRQKKKEQKKKKKHTRSFVVYLTVYKTTKPSFWIKQTRGVSK